MGFKTFIIRNSLFIARLEVTSRDNLGTVLIHRDNSKVSVRYTYRVIISIKAR